MNGEDKKRAHTIPAGAVKVDDFAFFGSDLRNTARGGAVAGAVATASRRGEGFSDNNLHKGEHRKGCGLLFSGCGDIFSSIGSAGFRR